MKLYILLLFVSISCTKDRVKARHETPQTERNQSEKEIDGDILYAKALNKLETKKYTKELFDNLLNEFPSNAFTVIFAEPDVNPLDNDRFSVKINARIQWDDIFLNNLSETMRKLPQDRNLTTHSTLRINRRQFSMNEFASKYFKNHFVQCVLDYTRLHYSIHNKSDLLFENNPRMQRFDALTLIPLDGADRYAVTIKDQVIPYTVYATLTAEELSSIKRIRGVVTCSGMKH